MQHHQPEDASKVLEIEYLPAPTFVLPILARIQGSGVPDIRGRMQAWREGPLQSLAMSLSTKLAILRVVVPQLTRETGLYQELQDRTKVGEYVSGGCAWHPRSKEVPYLILASVDSFIYEFRSAYEIVGKFLKAFFREIVGKELSERQVLGYLEEHGVPVAWAEQLEELRKLLFHERAPWLAVSIDHPVPGDRELLVLLDHAADPRDPDQCLTFSRIVAIFGGMESALHNLQEWAFTEIAVLETRLVRP